MRWPSWDEAAIASVVLAATSVVARRRTGRAARTVAGFTQADLEITVQDNQLLIRGKTSDDTERVYLHRGIAARQFQRSFVLAEGIEIAGATLENGLLAISLTRNEPEQVIRKISISSTR